MSWPLDAGRQTLEGCCTVGAGRCFSRGGLALLRWWHCACSPSLLLTLPTITPAKPPCPSWTDHQTAANPRPPGRLPDLPFSLLSRAHSTPSLSVLRFSSVARVHRPSLCINACRHFCSFYAISPSLVSLLPLQVTFYSRTLFCADSLLLQPSPIISHQHQQHHHSPRHQHPAPLRPPARPTTIVGRLANSHALPVSAVRDLKD